MSIFKALQTKHEELLTQQQEDLEQDLSDKVSSYIQQIREESRYVSSPREREQLRANLRYWANHIYEKTGVYPNIELAPSAEPSKKDSLKAILIAGSVVFLIVVVGILYSRSNSEMIALFATPTATATSTPTPTATSTPIPTATSIPTPTATSTPTATATYTPSPTATPTLSPAHTPRDCSSVSVYSFENDTMGWQAQTVEGSQAVFHIEHSTERAYFGSGSLELQVDLKGGDESNASGEAFVDLGKNAPAYLKDEVPLDMEGVPIIIWAYVPKEIVGDPNTPNGLQVFVKDEGGENSPDPRSQYGKWRNLTDEDTDRWIGVTLTVTEAGSPETGPGFDPSQIILLGIKVGAGSNYTGTFTGSIWIDDVCWPSP